MLAPAPRPWSPVPSATDEGRRLKQFTLQMRGLGAALMSGNPDPHAEWLTLLWGRNFDRTYAMDLLAQQGRSPQSFWLRRCQVAADLFDSMAPSTQQRLRRLVLRHRASFAQPELAMSE